MEIMAFGNSYVRVSALEPPSMTIVASSQSELFLVAWNVAGLLTQHFRHHSAYQQPARCEPYQCGSAGFNSKHKRNNPKTNIQIQIQIPTPITRFNCIFASNQAKLMFLNGNESRNYRLSINAKIISKD